SVEIPKCTAGLSGQFAILTFEVEYKTYSDYLNTCTGSNP
ncbi:MAG: hypothetical protein ACI9FD_004233, partial [Gammaproteobacteria bacterium]